MILPVVQLGEKILSQESQPVKKSDSYKKLITDMIDTMYACHGIGLAAVQVGVLKRIFVVDIPDVTKGPRVFINPKIEKYSLDPIEYEEGCLSILDVRGKVKRSRSIEVVYYDQDFTQHREIFDELFSICIQHETDHLNGILFLERLEKSEIGKIKRMVKKKGLPDEFFKAIPFGRRAFPLTHVSAS